MSKKSKRTVPELRFPKFEGDWQHQELSKVLIESNVMAFIDLPLYSLTIESGIVPKTERYERSFLVKNEAAAYKVVQPNDFAYNPMNLRFGALARHIESRPVKVSKYYNIFSVNPKENVLFVDHLLTKSSSIRLYDSIAMGSLVEKKRVHFSDFLNCNFLLPSIAEQEKIANFLGAVDTRLNQLRRKRELLQTYKRGVMQKLFSQEIRFKGAIGSEFPDWEKKKLGDVVIFKNGKAHENCVVENGKFIIVNSKFIATEGEVKKYSDFQLEPLKENDIVMVMSDVPNGKALAKCFYIRSSGKYTLNQRICSLTVKERTNSKYLYYSINRNKYFLEFDSGVSQTNLRKEEVLGCPVLVPSIAEQEKIADVLTVIDRKIEAISRQIEQCDRFKQGLLQKMFV